MSLIDWLRMKLYKSPSAIPRPPCPTDEPTLVKVRDILFPQIELHEQEGMKFMVDRSVDNVLDAILTDLMDGFNDESSQETIRRVIDRLSAVRGLLNANLVKIDGSADRIIFHPGPSANDEEIPTGEP